MVLKGMKWYNSLQFIVMCAAFGGVAVDWQIGLWLSGVLGSVTVVKIIAERRVGNPALSVPLRVGLLAGVAYWLFLVVSVLWSDNVARAMREMECEAVLLIAPLCVLLSDMSYIRENHLRVGNYRPCGSNTLLLTAGHLIRVLLQHIGDA